MCVCVGWHDGIFDFSISKEKTGHIVVEYTSRNTHLYAFNKGIFIQLPKIQNVSIKMWKLDYGIFFFHTSYICITCILLYIILFFTIFILDFHSFIRHAEKEKKKTHTNWYLILLTGTWILFVFFLNTNDIQIFIKLFVCRYNAVTRCWQIGEIKYFKW